MEVPVDLSNFASLNEMMKLLKRKFKINQNIAL